jgi:hypothetical protein
VVAVSTVLGATFPEYPVWKREAEEKLAKQERRTKEMRGFFQPPGEAERRDGMTEQEWLACTNSQPMLEFLRGKASERKLRLFACACCRRVWKLLSDKYSRKALKIA